MKAVTEFAGGFATLARGFAYWRTRRRLMLLGLVPALIVGVVIVAAIAVLIAFLGPITDALTFFATGWDQFWRGLIRVAAGVALVIATLALAARTYTAITLLVGAPFYDRIQAAVDAEQGGLGEDRSPGLARSILDTAVLIGQSLLATIVVALVGVVPVVGPVLGTVLGFVLTARALTRELTLAPLSRRGLDGGARRDVRRSRRARAFGFGVAVQLCYLVPLGAVLTMPAAVAGSALLARDLLGEPSRRARVTPSEA